MAICPSGNLSICATAGACRSISTAVGTGSGSLSALSVSAGKSPPHCMREFYSYAPKTAINWTQYTTYGTNGSSSYVYRYFCATPTPAAGQTYSLCIIGDLSNANQASGSWARICVTCNNLHKMCCCIPYTQICATSGILFTVDSNDCVRACVHACATNTSCSLCARASACIDSVTGTYHCKGSTCICGIVYTG